MNLVHHACSEITALEPRVYTANKGVSTYNKPVGFWVSVEGENSWQEWCLSESFGLDGLTHVHDVNLTPNANTLILSGSSEIDVFTDQYSFNHSWSGCYPPDLVIDWLRVAADYQGIIIAPYCWERRMTDHTRWYYGWDCASGCVWDLTAIESIKLREVIDPAVLQERAAA